MSAIAVADGLSVIGFGVALLFFFLLPVDPARPYVRPIKAFLLAAMGVYVFVGISNTLEWAGITKVLDPYEDYVEVLFIPFVAYIVYAMATAQQLEDTKRGSELLRDQHELLSSIVDTSPAGVLVVAADGKITFANGLAQDVLGLREAAAGRFLPPPDVRFSHEAGGVTGVGEGLEELLDRNPEGRVLRFVEHPGGRMIVIDVRTEPLPFAAPGRGSAVVAFVDTTAQMRYRQDLEEAVEVRTEELIELNSRLEVANDAKREFLTRMSHELRTPLSSIIGFTATLLAGYAGDTSAEQKKQLEAIRASSRQLLGLVDEVLDISLIEAGRQIVNWAPVDVGMFLRGVYDSMSPIVREAEIDVELDAPGSLGEAVTDEDKLAQVLRNLISHAIRSTPAGGWIRIVARGDDGSVTITVADSGAGIAPEDLDSVLVPFGQMVGRPGVRAQESGLGLAISHDLVDLLGGEIAVTSELDRGSTFTVTLPRRPRPRSTEVSGAPEAPSP